MKTVRNVLSIKGDTIWSTSPETSVYVALEKMARKNVGALVVLDKTGLVGVFSERDYARKIILKKRASKETLVREIMTREIVCVGPNEEMRKCMRLMSTHRFRHLPVVEHDRVIGIISIGDVVQAIICEQESAIHELEDYIIGRR